MSLNFNGNYIGGTPSGGGGGGTTNHAQLTNLDYEHSGHTGFLDSAKHIEHNTIFTVGTNKDFATLQEAYNNLEGKWCEGTVKIQLDAGEFNISSSLLFNKSFDIHKLMIIGESKQSTIIKYTGSEWSQMMYIAPQQNIVFYKLTLDGNNVTGGTGMSIDSAKVTLDNVAIKNNPRAAILNSSSSNIMINKTGVEVENCGIAFSNSFSSVINCAWQANISIKDCATAFLTSSGAIVSLNAPTATFTNVTTQYSPTVNTNASTQTGWNFVTT